MVSNRGRGSTKKTTGNTRRVWSNSEEQVLIGALHDLVNRGWKSENGFRTGYLNKLEDALKVVFPSTDLKVSPNINSKLTAWRKTYASLTTAHGTSGVGFNSTTNTIEYTDEQWAEVEKRDPSMRGMRYKDWPFFLDWKQIFGKDRATGEVAEDVPDAFQVLRAQYMPPPNTTPTEEFNGQNYTNENDTHNTFPTQNNFNEDDDTNSVPFTTQSAQPSSSRGKRKKSKKRDHDTAFADVLDRYWKSTGERLDKIASRMGYDHDLGKKRNEVFGMLGTVQGLTTVDRLEIAEYIGGRIECIEVFMGLDEHARNVYAAQILERARMK